MSDSTAPRDSASVNSLVPAATFKRGRLAAGEGERDHGAEVTHLALGERRGRGGRRDPGSRPRAPPGAREELGDDPGVRTLAVHADGEGLEPALHEVAVEGARHGAGGVLDEPEWLGELLVARHHGPPTTSE